MAGKPWTAAESEIVRRYFRERGSAIAEMLPGRTRAAVRGEAAKQRLRRNLYGVRPLQNERAYVSRDDPAKIEARITAMRAMKVAQGQSDPWQTEWREPRVLRCAICTGAW